VKPPYLGGLQGGKSPLAWGFRASKRKKMVFFASLFLAVFWHMAFIDGFLILVKELGLLINFGQWIRGFGFH
jgi:hypothetical protein